MVEKVKQNIKKTGICALCGKFGKFTKEHVPPKNLFLKPRPNNSITVHLCNKCNHSFHLDDEYFRVYISAGAQPGTKLWKLWKQKVVGSSFARSGGLRGRLNDEHELLLEYATSNPLQAYDGSVLPEELLCLVQPFEGNRINAVVEKIVRCLYYKHKSEVFNETLEVNDAPMTESILKDILSTRSGEVGYSDEFVYKYTDYTKGQTLWRLVFYRSKEFTVLASSR